MYTWCLQFSPQFSSTPLNQALILTAPRQVHLSRSEKTHPKSNGQFSVLVTCALLAASDTADRSLSLEAGSPCPAVFLDAPFNFPSWLCLCFLMFRVEGLQGRALGSLFFSICIHSSVIMFAFSGFNSIYTLIVSKFTLQSESFLWTADWYIQLPTQWFITSKGSLRHSWKGIVNLPSTQTHLTYLFYLR